MAWVNAKWANIIIYLAENKNVLVELAKPIRGEGFESVNVKDIQELLMEEETDEANLVEVASGVNPINSKSKIHMKIIKWDTLPLKA